MNAPIWRRRTATLLVALAAICACSAVVLAYARNTLLDSEQFASRSAAALDDPAVRDFLGSQIADEAIGRRPDLIAVRPVIESGASSIVGGSAFRGLYRAAVRDAHRAVIERDQNSVVLTLADVGTLLRSAVATSDAAVSQRIEGAADVHVIDGRLSEPIADAARRIDELRAVATLLALFAALFALAGWLLVRDLRWIAGRLGLALAVAALATMFLLGRARGAVLDAVGGADARAAADGLWSALLGDLRAALLLIAVAGAILAGAALSLLRAVSLDAPLRRAWELTVTTPASGLARLIRALSLLGAGVLTLLSPLAAAELAAIAVGLLLAVAGGSELLRLGEIAAPIRSNDAAPAAPGISRRRAGRIALAGLVAFGLLSVASALTVGDGGVSAEAPPIVRCNGHAELCDRPLDQVALAATHNSMSAADYPGWLFAQQEHGLARQLDDGIRSLLIDTHYGRRSGGRVKTDFGELTSVTRAKYVAEVGEEGLEAALRIRGTLSGNSEGERRIYLCHGLCELGALELSAALGDVARFLGANPHEILVLVVQDDVEPADFVAAVRAAGLERYAYEGPFGKPWPTLRRMIEDDRRLVILSEQDGSGAPWMENAFDVMQETPYSFSDASQLTGPDRLAASCKPNRGKLAAMLFQLNHWIDTTPAPRPSNAAKVNAREPLLARARACQKQRDLFPSVVAVDFYKQGDVFGVVDTLNGVG